MGFYRYGLLDKLSQLTQKGQEIACKIPGTALAHPRAPLITKLSFTLALSNKVNCAIRELLRRGLK